jgi:lipoprotein-anchoring transpeptidase ErfK/SrfK/LysM repeat protein
MTVPQLMQFNELKGDLIVIGQILRIPTMQELLMMAPPAPPPPDPKKNPAEPSVELDLSSDDISELENLRLQVFLDREGFSPGPIDGASGTTLLKVSEVYQRSHTDASSPEFLHSKAKAVVERPYSRYVLRMEDLKFIKMPKEEPKPPAKKRGSKRKAAEPAPPPPPLTIDDLLAEGFLGYTSAWEFVAERFHCDDTFLHYLNPLLKGTPGAGTEFLVPDVIPFEIEKALDPPLQPLADPQNPVTAAVVELSLLEISRNGKIIALMPMGTARPGLRGRGTWTVLDAIPQPRLATRREPRDAPKAALVGSDEEHHLACGPNNPIGIVWINLAKSDSTDPLPYGLHGTSIPSQMARRHGIGGFRLTNWDIARVVRLIPAGTPLEWRGK